MIFVNDTVVTTGVMVHAPYSFRVELNKIRFFCQDSIQGSKDVAVVFGISPCSTNSCPDATESFGQVIYGAPYNPQLNTTPGSATESETFSVPVPAEFKGDKVVLSLAHVVLIDVSSVFVAPSFLLSVFWICR